MNYLCNKLALAVASGLGSGYFPIASGTFGSLAALIFWVLIIEPLKLTFLEQTICITALVALGVLSTNYILKDISGSTSGLSKKERDPSLVVIDEWAGMWIALTASSQHNLYSLLLAFFAFRFFDVSKLGPIARAEKLERGWGVMADDVLAGIASLIVLRLSLYFFPSLLG